MNIKASVGVATDKKQLAQGVVLAFGAALLAEVTLRQFLEFPDLLGGAARIVLVFMGIYTLHRFARVSLRSYAPSWTDLFTLLSLLLASIVIISIGKLMAMSLTSYASSSPYFREITPEAFYFGIPFAFGVLILQSVLGRHYCLVFSLSLALIVGVYETTSKILFLYALVTCFIASLSLFRFRSRSAYLKAGLHIAIISLPFSLGSAILGVGFSPMDLLFRVLGALLGGALCAFIAAGITPLIEYLGGYVTDMRLIEMATLDHPLLKDLSVQTPGTWNHSMVMGMMVEAAADVIGANPVLARVGSYFHDIGKIKKPAYFVENQGGGENRHDKLSTSMSALIIRSHVKDGIELARKHKLPQVIEDMIPQHHGTSRIEYFYEKACKEAEELGEDAPQVDANLYSYPGPKPQTKEAGLLMLADGTEAAARTLTEPSIDRVQGLVQKMINKVFASGELDECELTLKDLHSIAKCFTRVLNGIYHQRIAYAEPAEKVSERSADEDESGENEKEDTTKEGPELEGRSSNKKSKGEASKKESQESGKEDLKRLGLS